MLLGGNLGELGGSEYLKVVHGLVRGVPPALDLKGEQALITLLTTGASRGLIRSAHDCADGGLAVTLAESAFDTAGIGLDVDVPAAEGSDAGVGHRRGGDALRRIGLTRRRERRPDGPDGVPAAGGRARGPAVVIGTTGGSRIKVAIDGTPALDASLDEAESVWSGSLAAISSGMEMDAQRRM